MSMKPMSCSVLMLCTLVVTLAAQTPMRPGRWDTTMQMSMANMPIQMPEMKSSRCITPEELKRDPSTGLPSGVPNNAQSACKVSDYKQTGNTVAWKIACTAPQAMTGDGEMTFVGDTYNGTMNMQTPQGAMLMKMTGKRVGDCTQ
jgi:hypothetical protein